MSTSDDTVKYDEVLTSILVNEKSILGFLSAVFTFLARRTDFYYVPEGPYENMGFPPGVAEELVVKVLRKCDPKSWKTPNGSKKPTDLNNEIMCSTVAQEVEVIAEGDDVPDEEDTPSDIPDTSETKSDSSTKEVQQIQTESEKQNSDTENISTPPIIPTQKNSETYNGAERENYCWSQTIMELDVTVKLPPDIKTSKDLLVTINSSDIAVTTRKGETIIKDSLPYKIKTIESFWSISEGKLLIHLEKIQERWWTRLLNGEEEIDLSKIDCSRPINELPEDHINKVRELQWNQERKLKGLPTSDEMRNIEILKKAWNAEGSPFKGQEFDPSVLSQSAQMFPPFPEQE